MSPTQAYYDWVAQGRHWDPARPVADMAASLRAQGYTVYEIGDESHLQANPPEDHTPFSATGWPLPSPKGRVLAFDVMPKNNNMGDLAGLARAMISAKKNNVPQAAFIKYINWTDENGNCFHESWEPGYQQRSSTDKGHIHVSIRSDFTDNQVAAGWNPWKSVVSQPTPPSSTLLAVDGQLGPKTITRWQQYLGTPADGVISTPSMLVSAVQRKLNSSIHAGLVVDGVGIRQDNHVYLTTRALQQYLGTPQDGRLSVPVSEAVKAIQRRLNGEDF